MTLFSMDMHSQKLSKLLLPTHKTGQYHHCLDSPVWSLTFPFLRISGQINFLSWLVNSIPTPSNAERSMLFSQGFLP
jgi:hypothetical protein